MCSSNDIISKNYSAIINYIIRNIDIAKISEKIIKNNEYYIIEPINNVKIDEHLSFNIYNDYEMKYNKQKCEEYEERISKLEIFSQTKNTKYILSWINRIKKEYEEYKKNKLVSKQLYVDLTYNTDNNSFDIYDTPWSSTTTFENIYFKDKENIVNSIIFFNNNREWYMKRGLPYNIGFLLYGEPGTGKTSFIKALANLTKRHIINIKLSDNMDYDELRKELNDEYITQELIIPISKRLYIFEDIDCMGDVVLSRKTNDGKQLNKMLNILDGVQECSDRMIVMTTNYIDKLDEALIRPGRIDYKINMTKATNEDIINIIGNYYDMRIMLDNDYSNKYTHAEVVSLCRKEKDINRLISSL